MSTSRIVWLATGLAVLASLSYLLIVAGVLGVGDLEPAERHSTIVYVAAACYFGGGLLILARRPWLWAIGAAVNALVILFFLQLYANRPSVLLSPGGVVSKLAQVLLEFALLALIFGSLHLHVPRHAPRPT